MKLVLYCAVQKKNSVPAAAGAVATSHTVFLLNIVLTFSLNTVNMFYEGQLMRKSIVKI